MGNKKSMGSTSYFHSISHLSPFTYFRSPIYLLPISSQFLLNQTHLIVTLFLTYFHSPSLFSSILFLTIIFFISSIYPTTTTTTFQERNEQSIPTLKIRIRIFNQFQIHFNFERIYLSHYFINLSYHPSHTSNYFHRTKSAL